MKAVRATINTLAMDVANHGHRDAHGRHIRLHLENLLALQRGKKDGRTGKPGQMRGPFEKARGTRPRWSPDERVGGRPYLLAQLFNLVLREQLALHEAGDVRIKHGRIGRG